MKVKSYRQKTYRGHGLALPASIAGGLPDVAVWEVQVVSNGLLLVYEGEGSKAGRAETAEVPLPFVKDGK